MKFIVKQKGKNKIKDYKKTREKIISVAINHFGCDVEDVSELKINNSIIIYQNEEKIDRIIHQKFIKRMKSGFYLFKQIKTQEQILSLLIHFDEPIKIKTGKSFRNCLLPASSNLIYVFTTNQKNC